MTKRDITIIGDVHGKHAEYLDIIKDKDFSIQLGDFGFNYSCLYTNPGTDGTRHRIILGNHDNYDQRPIMHECGDFSLLNLNGFDIYTIRGAFSIDWKYRIENVSWWRNEELSHEKCAEVLSDYSVVKPDIVMTHSAPKCVVDLVTYKEFVRKFGYDPNTFITNTQILLDECFRIHQPKLWVFGHYHRSKTIKYRNTKFVCLNELETASLLELLSRKV